MNEIEKFVNRHFAHMGSSMREKLIQRFKVAVRAVETEAYGDKLVTRETYLQRVLEDND